MCLPCRERFSRGKEGRPSNLWNLTVHGMVDSRSIKPGVQAPSLIRALSGPLLLHDPRELSRSLRNG